MAGKPREEQIAEWVDRIERSRLSARQYLARYCVPFSLAQYYRYRDAHRRHGLEGLGDGRSRGKSRVIGVEAEGFLLGYVSAHQEVTLKELRKRLRERFDIEVSPWGLNKCMRRLGIGLQRTAKSEESRKSWTPYGGFQLVLALAWYYQWPQATAEVIQKATAGARRSKRFATAQSRADLQGRNRGGEFTARYNRRLPVREQRFESVEVKRRSKWLPSMDLFKVRAEALARKCVAILALPLVTHNGEMRTVDTAPGMALKAVCGFQYKQATLAKFLSELKYVGVSEALLRHQVDYWQERWREEVGAVERHLPLLCYYVDGNTKALWSSKRVKKNKVSMLGRVMGCLEQVFVHDSHGRPIYFETYSGHAPMGEYILSLFEKIENSLEGGGSKLPIQRAIVMDAASNSVRTLRAFAAQKKYHYITSLDANQWHPRKIRKEGRPQRYRHGSATLWDCEIELEDSKEKNYLLVTRAIKIGWDQGKETYLVTSLPKGLIGASVVVKSYFDRWPYQELEFKVMKAVACLNRVAGYGKQKLADKNVQQHQRELAWRIGKLKKSVAEAQAAIEKEEAHMATLMTKERRLRAQSRIIEGQRMVSEGEAQELNAISRRISRHQSRLKAIRKDNPDCQKLERAQREWMRLQGKETVYKVDVELDQIMTYFRLSLVNLYSYLAHLLKGSRLSLVKLLHTVLLLPGTIEESKEMRQVVLEKNEKDPETMERLAHVIKVINKMNIRDDKGKRFNFAIA